MALTHVLDGSVVSLSQLYLRIYGTLSTGAPPEFDAGGPDVMKQLATKYGLELTDSQLELTIVVASRSEAEVLGLKAGAEVVQASAIESGKRLVGFIRTVIRTDNFAFSAAVHRSPQTSNAEGMSMLLSKSN